MTEFLFAEQRRNDDAFAVGLRDLIRGEDTLEAEIAIVSLAQCLNAMRGRG